MFRILKAQLLSFFMCFARIDQGILGGISGKVGGVVGGNWRGVNYVRAYAVPANPDTAAQRSQRTKMSVGVRLAKSVLDSILNRFWLDKYPHMSPFNSFLKVNLPKITDELPVYAGVNLTEGPLEGVAEVVGALNPVAHTLTVTFSAAVQGNGLPTDKIGIVYYNPASGVSVVSLLPASTRTSGSIVVNNCMNEAGTTAWFWCFAYRTVNGKDIVSLSTAAIADTP